MLDFKFKENFRKSIQPLKPYIPGRPIDDVKAEYQLENVVKLASNENPYGCSQSVKAAVLASLADVALYPDGYCAKLRAAVASFYDVPADNLVFGAGSDEIISMLAKIFIEPADEAITAQITFPQYAAAVTAMGGIIKTVPMHNHAYNLTAILQEITPKTKLIFLANPNNPTGTYFGKQEQTDFLVKINKISPKIVVIFDEAYKEYVSANDFPETISQMAENPNIVVLRTFSKAYGLAGLRVGFGICHKTIVEQLEKIRQPFNVTNLAQAAALAALADQNFVQKSHQLNRQIMQYTEEKFAKMGLFSVPSQANFLMTDVARDSLTVFEKLMQKGYIIRPGAAFGMEKFIRLTIGTEQEMNGFLAEIKEVLK
ncbi:MAG: histidinol-phosphate transaminase [Defluviitaleaceae bacterium]|nr:histidinol-phosphate transaminase [Defluviitaleaceae bacterium]